MTPLALGIPGVRRDPAALAGISAARDARLAPLKINAVLMRDTLVSAAELLDVLGRRFALTQPHRDDPSAPAEEWLVDGGPATLGIIASVPT